MNLKRLLTLVVMWPAIALADNPASIPVAPPLPTLASLEHPSETPLPVSASATPTQPMVQHSKGNSFDLRFATVSYVVDFVYENAVKTPHVIGPDVLADQRQVSFRYKSENGDLRRFLSAFLDSLGYVVTVRDGVDFIGKKPDADQPKGMREPFVYVPRYRKADYLMRLVQPLVGGRFTTQRGVSLTGAAASQGKGEIARSVPPESAAAMIDQSTDQLVFMGTPDEIEALQKVLPMVDVARGKVNLRAWVYEVNNTTQDQSGFALAVSLFGAAVGLNVNNGLSDPSASTVQLRAGNAVTLGIQALDADSRFKVLTRPNLTVLSGDRARLNVGQQVPTQGQVSYQGPSGTPVQSVVYQDAGVIFDVQPTVMRDTIELAVEEEISDFVRTSTGVNTSPTKNTRKLQTVTTLSDGEVAVIGGLLQSHDSLSSSGLSFLPKWAKGHGSLHDRTEIVLVLQVTKI